jgi:hypothetical protein
MDYVQLLLKNMGISPPDVDEVKRQVEKILRGLLLI